MERRSRLVPFIGLLGLAVLIVGIPASGAIPNPGDGRFYGCMVKATGVVKLINYPKVNTCPKGQRLIDWGRTGPQGPQGPEGGTGVQGGQGAQGTQGLQGAPGITKITLQEVIEEDTHNGLVDESLSVNVECPVGSKVTGGGFSSPAYTLRVIRSNPEGNGWEVRVRKMETGDPPVVRVYAICMTTEPSTVIAKVAKKGKGK